MAQLNIGRDQMGNPDKLHAALRHAIQEYDFDSGWVGLSSGRVVKLNGLGILPRTVRVFSSDDPGGKGFGSESFSDCTATEIVIGGAKKYARVMANR